MADRRGPQALTARDWLFGSRVRRQAIDLLLRSESAPEGWTKSDLAREIGVSPHGGVDNHLDALERIGLVHRAGTRFRSVRPPPRLALQIQQVLETLESVP